MLPDPFSTDILRAFSAPPVTKPRLPEMPSSVIYESRAPSYGLYSSGAVSPSEAQRQHEEQMISPFDCVSDWPSSDIAQQELMIGHNSLLMQPGIGYSDDDDSNGFTTYYSASP